jgi:hypothetical protein
MHLGDVVAYIHVYLGDVSFFVVHRVSEASNTCAQVKPQVK